MHDSLPKYYTYTYTLDKFNFLENVFIKNMNNLPQIALHITTQNGLEVAANVELMHESIKQVASYNTEKNTYNFSQLVDGKYDILITAEGYETEQIQLTFNNEFITDTIILKEKADYTRQLFNKFTQLIYPNVKASSVWILTPNLTPIESAELAISSINGTKTSIKSSKDGICLIGELPSDTYKLVVKSNNYETQTYYIQITAGEIVKRKIVLAKPNSIYLPIYNEWFPLTNPSEYVSFQYNSVTNDGAKQLKAEAEFQTQLSQLKTKYTSTTQKSIQTTPCVAYPSSQKQRVLFENEIANSTTLKTYQLYVLGDCNNAYALLPNAELQFAKQTTETEISNTLSQLGFSISELKLQGVSPQQPIWRVKVNYKLPLSHHYLKAFQQMRERLPLLHVDIAKTISIKEHKINNKPVVSIQVYSFNSQVLVNIKAEMNSEKGNYLATYNALSGSYEFKNLEQGHYTLTVSANEFESQTKSITYSDLGITETIILGKKGMSFYYRGKIKVPFQANENLIGIVVDNANTTLNKNEFITSLEKKFNLKLHPNSSNYAKSNIYLFQTSSNLSDDEKTKLGKALLTEKNIKSSGAVLTQSEKNVTLLSDELILKFKSTISEKEITKLIETEGLEIIRQIPYVKFGYQVKVKSGSTYKLLQICERLIKNEYVEYAEPNTISTTEND